MSSVDSTSMASSEVSDKGPIDFAVKTVSLKAPTDSSRHLPVTGPLRTLPSPTVSRQTSTYPPVHPSSLGSTQKSVGYSRLSTAVSSMSSGTAVTAKPPLSTSVVTSTTPTYLIPRGSPHSMPSQSPRTCANLGRASLTIQPVTNIQPMIRTPTSAIQCGTANNLRAPSPGSAAAPRPAHKASNRSTGQHIRLEGPPRPIIIPAAPNRPLTITPTQLHIATDSKTMKGSVLPIRPTTFCSVPAFVGQNPTAILQRADGMNLSSGTPTVLTAPVRLAPPLAPLLTTQRVSVSVTPGTRLAIPQHVTVTPAPRPTAGPTRLSGPNQGQGPPGQNKMAGQPVPAGAILTGRVTYTTGPIVTGPPPVSRPPQQVPVTSKPAIAAVMTSGTRLSTPSNHQQGSKQLRAGMPRPSAPTVSITGGLLLHPQIMVTATNHARPALVASASNTKVIQQTIAAPLQLTTSTPSVSRPAPSPTSTQITHINPVSSKPPEGYKMTPNQTSVARHTAQTKNSSSNSTGSYPQSSSPCAVSSSTFHEPEQFMPTSQSRSNPSPGVLQTQATITERPLNAPTLSTYTLPSGTSYFFEAPSGYQLATDAPLVARPLSPDTGPLVARQLSTEGPLIARPFTPGLIASTQAMRFNPVMIVDSNMENTNTVGNAEPEADSSSSTASKITSSPRPSILRKRDNDGNISNKVVKNLSSSLSGSRSRTPSPPTPPSSSLHLETSQPATDVGPSSNGSSTISATSSPGPEDNADPDRHGPDVSPRKKPRKQLLNDANDSIDMEFISEEKLKKNKEAIRQEASQAQENENKTYVMKRPPSVSLLRSYKSSWKSRNNHFQRYAEVKPREERRPSVTELASQRNVSQRCKGWKLHHLSTQFENMSALESSALERLPTIFKPVEHLLNKECEKEMSRVNELVMGNIQRSKVIADQMTEIKGQMLKGIDHLIHVSEIISRCASKRNFKKRDKY